MELLLVGRVVQGAAGGLLAGLGLRGHQFGSAAVVVDQGVGARVGDVGRRHTAGSGRRRTVRAIRFVALGIRRARGADGGDGGAGAVRAARRAPGEPPTRVTGFRCGRCCCSVRRRWRSASRASRATSAWTVALLVAGRALVALFLVVDRRTTRGGVAAHGLSARPAEVDLPHARHADGRDDGRHVRAAVRSAAGAPGAGGGGLPRRGTGGRVDDERDRRARR